jgi:uncharacterized protein (UPF0548 family)
MISLTLPSSSAVQAFLDKEKTLPLTYTDYGGTAWNSSVEGYDNDSHRVKIGHGDADFAIAKEAIRTWKMFPPAWTVILPANTPIKENETIAMFAKAYGLWWRNSCRVVYVVDEPLYFGFAYGTLPGHIEEGEELFLVEKAYNGDIWYSIKAFSKPHHWLAKIGYPFMRRFQARFRYDSGNEMLKCKS